MQNILNDINEKAKRLFPNECTNFTLDRNCVNVAIAYITISTDIALRLDEKINEELIKEKINEALLKISIISKYKIKP